MKYFFIDTNNLVACSLLIKPNHSPTTIKKLKELLDKNKIKLLLPEIVEIEFFRVVDYELSKIGRIVKNFKNNVIDFGKVINENLASFLGTNKKNFIKSINAIYEKRKISSELGKNIIKSLFEAKNTIKIPLTHEIFTNAFKRALGGKKPFKFKWCSECNELRDIIDADCLIFESILSKTTKLDQIELLFCSDDKEDFASYEEKKKEYILHPELAKDLPKKTKYYSNLGNALDYEFKAKIKPDEKEKIKTKLKYIETERAFPYYSPPSDYLRTGITSINLPMDALGKGMSSINMPLDAIQKSVASINLPFDALQKSVASINLPLDVIQKSVASINLPFDALGKGIKITDTTLGLQKKEQKGVLAGYDFSDSKLKEMRKKKNK